MNSKTRKIRWGYIINYSMPNKKTDFNHCVALGGVLQGVLILRFLTMCLGEKPFECL